MTALILRHSRPHSVLLALGLIFATSHDCLAQQSKAPSAAQPRPIEPPKPDLGEFPFALRNVARQAGRSVVTVNAIGRPLGRCGIRIGNRHIGSGFVIDPTGIILTTSPLVQGAEIITIGLADGSEFLVSSFSIDPRSNVAVLRVSDLVNIPALPLGESDTMQLGDWVVGASQTPRLTPAVSAGIIKSIVPGPGLARGEDFFQTDVAFQAGSEGSPLLNLNGEVVGMVSSNGDLDDLPTQTGMAVPINLVKWSSKQLIDNGVVTRGYLGLVTARPGRPLDGEPNGPVPPGAIISQVLPNTPAAEAGLLAGDTITKVNGQGISNARHLLQITEQLEPGKTYPVEFIREGETRTVNVVAGKMSDHLNATPPAPPLGTMLNPRPTPSPLVRLGTSSKRISRHIVRIQ